MENIFWNLVFLPFSYIILGVTMNWQEMIRGNNWLHAGIGLDIKMDYLD